jgi:hypothetical protein
VRVPAGLHHVRVPDQRVVPGAGLEDELGLGVERRVVQRPQHREGGLPVGHRPAPELGVGQVDVLGCERGVVSRHAGDLPPWASLANAVS